MALIQPFRLQFLLFFSPQSLFKVALIPCPDSFSNLHLYKVVTYT